MSEPGIQAAVLRAVAPYLEAEYGNPSSVHRLGAESKKATQQAREAVAALMACLPEEVHFAPSLAVANQTAILGRARFAEANGLPRRFRAAPADAPAVSECLAHLAQRGWEVDVLPQLPVLGIADAPARAADCVHVDVETAVGTIDVLQAGAQNLAANTVAFSARFLHAALPVAVLVVRRGVNVMPLFFGGGQERGLFPGTEPVVAIVGLGKAAEVWLSQGFPSEASR